MTTATPATEPRYEVVWPQGRPAYEERRPNARLSDLDRAVIGELWDYLFRGEEIFPILREQLRARYPGIRFVTYDVFGNVHGPRRSRRRIRRRATSCSAARSTKWTSVSTGGSGPTACPSSRPRWNASSVSSP